MTYTPTEQFNLHWQGDHELYDAVLDYARGFMRQVPKMSPQTMGFNIIANVRRWCADGYVSAVGWDPDTGRRGGPKAVTALQNQLRRFPDDEPVPPNGYRPVATDVLERMAAEMGDNWTKVDQTGLGTEVMKMVKADSE